MVAFWRRASARIGRWPRRVAALICLLLAVVTALAPRATPSAPARHSGLGLGADEVAVPVPLAVPGLAGHLHGGDRVGVLYAPSEGARGSPQLVADRVRVLSVDVASDYGTDATATVLLAVQRPDAVRLARFATQDLRLVVDR